MNFLKNAVWADYALAMNKLTEKIKNKKVIIYGYQGQGYFLKWFLFELIGVVPFAIIDDRDYIFDCNILKPTDLISYKWDTTDKILLVAKEKTNNVFNTINTMGFSKENTIFIFDLFEGPASFFSWSEKHYDTDFMRSKNIYSNQEQKNYSAITERAAFFVEKSIPKRMSILDVGAGKGAAAAYFASCGRKTGLVEFDSELVSISKRNFRNINLDAVWYSRDASLLTGELDSWDCFVMYNPFCGPMFERFIKNIIDSKKRNPRDIIVSYGNPIEWKTLEENGFKLIERIIVDCSCRYWNNYKL